MRLLDLFSGIGGFALASKWTWGDSLDIVGFCEVEKYAQKVLQKNFPGVPIYDDITKLDGNRFKDIDLLTGGFPCQDISVAGHGKGLIDEKGNKTRSGLWFEMHRIISEVRPRFALIENVPMLTLRGGTRVIADLTSIGYDCEWQIVGADDVGAWHRRKRIWIVAYPNNYGWDKPRCKEICSEDDGRKENKSIGRTCTDDIEPQNSDGRVRERPKTNRANSIRRDGKKNKTTTTKGVRRLSKETDQSSRIIKENRDKIYNHRTLVQKRKIFQPSINKGLGGNKTIFKSSRIRYGNDPLGVNRMDKQTEVPDTKQRNVQAGCERQRSICEVGEGERTSSDVTSSREDIPDTKSERYGGRDSKECGDKRRQIFKGKQGRSKVGSEVEGCSQSLAEYNYRATESELGLLAHGLSTRLGGYWDREPDIPRVTTGIKDRVSKLKGLGNAIVPQVAQLIMERIKCLMEKGA